MPYQKVHLASVPQVFHSHQFSTRNYGLSFNPRASMLEITYIEKGEVEAYRDGQLLYKLPEKSIAVNFYDHAMYFTSKAPIHTHTTVGLVTAFTLTPMTNETVLQCNRALSVSDANVNPFAILPYHMGLPLSNNSRVPRLFEKIIQANAVSSGHRSLTTSALAMELMAEVTKECVQNCFTHEQLPPSDMLYTEKAIAYITNNLSQKIQVEDIAKAVGISTGYLSGVFKTVTGKTMVEYINLAKLQRAKELILHQQISVQEAGEQVGISDAGYLSRLFRKHLDISIREIKKQKKF